MAAAGTDRRAPVVPRAQAVAAAVEVLTGLALLAGPALVARLLLGAEPGPGLAMLGRLAGLGLLGLGLAAWPVIRPPLRGAARALLLWQPIAALGLAGLWISGGGTGPLLLPALAYHLVAGAVLALRR